MWVAECMRGVVEHLLVVSGSQLCVSPSAVSLDVHDALRVQLTTGLGSFQ